MLRCRSKWDRRVEGGRRDDFRGERKIWDTLIRGRSVSLLRSGNGSICGENVADEEVGIGCSVSVGIGVYRAI